jgi:hypothetical protein
MKLANAFEPVQDGPTCVYGLWTLFPPSEIGHRWPLRATSDRGPFLYQLKGTPVEYKAGLERAIAQGWLLFGASFSLIVTGIGLAALGHVLLPRWGSTVTGIVAVLVGGLAYIKGRTAQPAGWLAAILAWIFGFFASGLFYAPFLYVALLTRGTTQ